MTKGFFKRLVKMDCNTRAALRVGRTRMWIDREDNGDYRINDLRFYIAYDAAMYLRKLALADAAQLRHDNRFN